MEKYYLPLSFLNDNRITPTKTGKTTIGDTWSYVQRELIDFGIPKKNLPSKEWFIKYILDRDFMFGITADELLDVFKKDIPFMPFNMKKFLDCRFWKIAPQILRHYGYTEEQMFTMFSSKRKVNQTSDGQMFESGDNKYSVMSEVRDSQVAPLILDKWIRNKQVYRPEATFSKYLLKTDSLSIVPYYLEHLPYSTFYLDLTEASKEIDFGDIHGTFVNITKGFNDTYALTLYIISNQKLMFSYYLNMNEVSMKKISMEMFEESVTLDTIPRSKVLTNVESTDVPAQKIMLMVLQMICYLNVKKPDIKPADEMRKTYHPRKSGNIKNTYSEVMINEVGVTIGSTISSAETKKTSDTTSEATGTHRSPSPHMRKAHWHHFWCGSEKDDTKHLELRWIEPVFVGSQNASNAQNVTIHPVE